MARGFFQDFLGRATGGILGSPVFAQPPVQGPPTPVARPPVGQRGEPSQVGRLFQNPAFLSALNSFGQTLVQPGQVPGQPINTGRRLVQGLGAFNQQFAEQQGVAEARTLQDELKRAQLANVQARTAQLGQPPALTPFQEQSLALKRQQAELARAPKPFTTVQKDEFRESRNQLQAGLDAVRKLKATDPSKLGAVGAARGAVETTRGIIGDIGGFIPGLQGVSAAIRAAPDTDTVRGLKPTVSKLATAVARARSGTTGRLNVDQLRTARENTEIIGAFGSQQALDALDTIEKELQNSLTALGGRAQAGGFNLKLKQVDTAKDATDEDLLRIISGITSGLQ